MLLRFFSLIIFLTFFVLYSCDRTIPPEKFESLPKESFWAGGIDNGHWFNVNKFNDSIVNISIYHDYNGELWQTINFKLCKECSDVKINFKDLVNEIINYDGTNINLKSKSSVYRYYCYLEEVP